jgi:hypothetical protein
MRTVSGFLVACLCFSGSALCQQEIPASPPTLKQRPPADHRLHLDVVVTHKAAQPVSGTNRALHPVVQIMFVRVLSAELRNR